MAKLVPYTVERPSRKGGFFKGQIWEAEDCWEPDEELIASMEKGTVEPESKDRKS